MTDVDTKKDLCVTCHFPFATCHAGTGVTWGNGKGNDKVIACDSYEVSQRSPNIPVERELSDEG